MAKRTVKPSGVIAAGQTTSVEFDYVQSQDFRIIPVMGATGHLVPTDPSQVFVWLWSEHLAPPTKNIADVNSAGQSTPERPAATKNAVIVRPIQVGMVLNSAKARLIGNWLIEKADESDNTMKQLKDRK